MGRGDSGSDDDGGVLDAGEIAKFRRSSWSLSSSSSQRHFTAHLVCLNNSGKSAVGNFENRCSVKRRRMGLGHC
jgi:hypothetical protein